MRTTRLRWDSTHGRCCPCKMPGSRLLGDLGRASRYPLKLGNALLGGLVVWVMLGSSPGTAAYLSATRSGGSNVLSTATQFTISDVTAVAQPGGQVLVSWSAASWAG